MLRKFISLILVTCCLLAPVRASYAWSWGGGGSYSQQETNYGGQDYSLRDFSKMQGYDTPKVEVNQSFWSQTWNNVKSFINNYFVQPVRDWIDTTFKGAKFVSELKVPDMGFLEGKIKLYKDGSIDSIREGTTLTLDKENMPFQASDGQFYRSGKFDYSPKEKTFIPQKGCIKATDNETKLASFIQGAKQNNAEQWESLLRNDYNNHAEKDQNLNIIKLKELADSGEMLQTIGAIYRKLENEDMVLYAAAQNGTLYRVEHKSEYMNDLGQSKKVNVLKWNIYDPKSNEVKQAKTLNFESYKPIKKNETFLVNKPRETYNHQIRISASEQELANPQSLINTSTYDNGLKFHKLDIKDSQGFQDCVTDIFSTVANDIIKDRFDGVKEFTVEFGKSTAISETVGKVIGAGNMLDGISKDIISSGTGFTIKEAIAGDGMAQVLDSEKLDMQSINTEFQNDFRNRNYEIRNFEVKYDKLTQSDVNELVLGRKQDKVVGEVAETVVNSVATAGATAIATPAVGVAVNKTISYTQRAISTANKTQSYDATQTRLVGSFTIGLSNNDKKSYKVNFSGRLGVHEDSSGNLKYGIVQMSYEKDGLVEYVSVADRRKKYTRINIKKLTTHSGEENYEVFNTHH